MNSASRLLTAWAAAATLSLSFPTSARSAEVVPSPSSPPATLLDAAGNSPLHLAVLRDDDAAVDALIAQGADVNALNQAGATPLHYAVTNARIVTALLTRGAKPDVVSKIGITPLLGAVSRPDSFPVARQLIEAGANLNAQRRIPVGLLGGANVLALAVANDDARTIALLLERKAELNPKQGMTPLGAAAMVGNLEVTRELLKRGAEIDRPGGMQGTALNTAFFAGHADVAKLLIEQGADLRAKSILGYATPPMVWSAYNDAGDPALAKLLVSRGVDLDTANETGETALSLALKNGPDTELVRYLRSAGAKPPATPMRAKAIPSRQVPTSADARAALVRDRTQRSVDLLQRNSTAFLENGFVRNQTHCVSCHQQALPAVAFGLARERGLHVDERELGRQLAATVAEHARSTENARELDEPTPGRGLALGYDADGLHALGYAPDQTTEVSSRYLLAMQRTDGSWATDARRPPMADGQVVGTAWSLRAVQLYPPAGRAREVAEAMRRARAWLAQQAPRSLNDRIFQLLGLAWASETPERMRPFAEALMKEQRPDGGWAQLPGLECDAWATGSALIALHKAGTAPSHATYQRGVDFLLRTQFDDGSWWVRSRTWPFQPHFDGKFPHGKDQWISAGGTAWATMALLLTLEPSVPPQSLPNGQQLIAAVTKLSGDKAAAALATVADVTASGPAAAIDFARDIQPLFERSCAGCHGGERPRAGFTLVSRESLLKGGQSGDPAIVPGHAATSPLFLQVSDQVEDLEMPPLARREKYPALSPEEIARIRTWIDAGASWKDARASN
jgi:ankyrin repeat protein